MKAIGIFLVLTACVALAAILTKPSDEQCVELIKSKLNTEIDNASANPLLTGVGSVLIDMGVKKVLFRIEDKIFYKNIYFIVDNRKIGTGLFGTVIIS